MKASTILLLIVLLIYIVLLFAMNKKKDDYKVRLAMLSVQLILWILIALMEWGSTGMYMHVIYAVLIALSIAQIAATITKKQ